MTKRGSEAPKIDGDARRAIREDIAETLVVEAAAGTGKTTQMIARIIEVIRTGTAKLSQIVAVTFTDKAAGEMKLRLRIELERARKLATAGERSRFDAALAELEIARIGTIHSFCADLLRERPIEAKVDPLFEVAGEDEADRMFQQAFDAWFQSVLAAPGEGVRRILRRDHPTELLRSAGRSLIGRRDFDGVWRRDPFDRDREVDAVVARFVELGALASRAYKDSDPLAKMCARLARWTGELARKEAIRARDRDGLEAELFAITRWYEWKWRGMGTFYGEGLPRADVIAQKDAAFAALVAFRDAADADLAACLHAELRPLVDEYVRLEAHSGTLDFFDLLACARNLLRDDRTVREDYQRRFTHFFVDEFQDTDPLQVQILLLLASDDPATSDPDAVRVRAGKLFVVGDPKQAIYRFRRADVALYEAVKQRLLAGGARLVELTTSFRAVPSIQTVVNAAFAPVMIGDGQAGYVPLARDRSEVEGRPTIIALPVPEPYGVREISNKSIEESYPRAVGGFVEWLFQSSGWGFGARDVCLMFRRFQSFNTDLTRPYVRALEARQIPHVLVGGRSFHDREEIQAVRSALAAIEWPDDELSVYATLRGPFFAFHDEDLLAFQQAHRRLHPLQWIDAKGSTSSTSGPVRDLAATGGAREPEDVAGALATLAALHVERNRRPVADTLSRLLAATRAHAGFAMWPAGEQALANVLRVMDLARKFETHGATSFRAFVERMQSDVDRGRAPDAMVVEEGTEGVRIMTAHAAKGLEFGVVILCDPTAPLAQTQPSRYVDATRRLWLEPLARCVPSELRERSEEVLRRDREEGQRLAYVAATRARDLLVVPVVGDEERDSWIGALNPVVYPEPARKRERTPAPGCPAFGEDSVLARGKDTERGAFDSVMPGYHVPRTGGHRVAWWDPRTLDLDREIGGGFRQRQILQADESGVVATASIAAHAQWLERRAKALVDGMKPTRDVRSITAAAKTVNAGWADVVIHDTGIDRAGRPRGKRFGILVHAVMAGVDLGADVGAIRSLAHAHGRVVAAPPDEIEAAVVAVAAALHHPLIARAAAAPTLRREVPVVLHTSEGMLEGIVDLAFADADRWTVVDYKTDAELDGMQVTYEHQVRLYAQAIANATKLPTSAVLLIV